MRVVSRHAHYILAPHSPFSVEVNDYASLGSCDTQCQDSYAFAVVQGTTCWCSNYAPGTQVAVAECSETCPGYPYEYCGSTASNLYGYMALSKSALGTSYTSTSTAVSTATKVSVATTTALATTTAAAQRTTVVVTSVNTIVSTQAIVTTEVVSYCLLESSSCIGDAHYSRIPLRHHLPLPYYP